MTNDIKVSWALLSVIGYFLPGVILHILRYKLNEKYLVLENWFLTNVFTLFGTNLEKIPCFKRTFTLSTFSGIAAGLGHFLFTSKAKRSADVAVVSFLVTTIGFWVHCRYNWAKEYAITHKMNRNLHEVMVSQGVKPPKDV